MFIIKEANDIIARGKSLNSFTSRVEQQKKANKHFNDGIEMLKAVKAEHGDTILKLFMVSFHEGENSTSPNNWHEGSEIRGLVNFLSCFVPTNNNPFYPVLSSERKNNLAEEVKRFESNYQRSDLDKTGIWKDDRHMNEAIASFCKIFVRLDASDRRSRNIQEGKFKTMFDNAMDGIASRYKKLLFRPDETVTVKFDININTKELSNKTEKLIADLEKFKNSEAGQSILNFSSKHR